MSDLLRVEGLTKIFTRRRGWLGRPAGHVTAVDDVSLVVGRGEVLGLVGESGSGKTTLGRCILRLIEPTSGKVQFDGQDLLALPGRALRRMRRHLQIVFQDPYGSLNPRMSAGAIVAEPLAVHRLVPRSERKKKVAELFRLVGLDPALMSRYPHEFSGGQRQRIGIARALAVSPKLVVADEPVSALDLSVQAQILNLMVDLQERLSLAYLFIAHDLSVVRHIADRVAVMYLGRIVESGPTAGIFDGPLHPYTRALLDAVPLPDPERRRRRLEPAAETGPRPVGGCAYVPRCPLVVERCRREVPPLRPFPGGHLSACHRVEEGPGGPVLPLAGESC